MKRTLRPQSPRFALLCGALALLSLPGRGATQGLQITAHEWGTFTTVSSSDGRPLPGLFIDATPLPGFVNTLPFFAGAPAASGATSSLMPSDSALAALSSKWRGVTTKMETPVLYFYVDYSEPVPIDVTARFPGGTLHEFYPPRQGGEENPAGPFVDFAQPREGRIEWHAEVLPQKLSDSTFSLLTHRDGGNSPEWQAPRAPRSNLVRAGGEVESYLFYRGLGGNLALPLKMRFTGDSTLELTNSGPDTIAHLVVYDQAIQAALTQAGVVWWQGALKPYETLRLRLDASALPANLAEREAAFQGMRQGMDKALQHAGLTPTEAGAMLNTWDRSYWGDERGFKVFWILPRALIDSLVPLTMTSSLGCNYTVERVFIARSEILMPAFERSLRAGWELPFNERHRLAYRAAALLPTTGLGEIRRNFKNRRDKHVIPMAWPLRVDGRR